MANTGIEIEECKIDKKIFLCHFTVKITNEESIEYPFGGDPLKIPDIDTLRLEFYKVLLVDPNSETCQKLNEIISTSPHLIRLRKDSRIVHYE